LSFVDAGATWIHVVDLDAARSGVGTNRAIVARIAATVAGRALVQCGGGVRSIDDAAELADGGVARVVMGTAAVNDPALVDLVSNRVRVAVGLDHRAGEVAVHGWTAGSGRQLTDLLGQFPSASAFVITEIGRDGMLTGPDVEGLRAATLATQVPVIASGGVGSLADLAALMTIESLAGVICGKALYEGRFDVAQALAQLR
jgi:phosphoribosylformimino-5-aminoimidazole carboxamide ribotide isomerase